MVQIYLINLNLFYLIGGPPTLPSFVVFSLC